MNLETIGRWLVLIGLTAVLVGGLIWLAGRYLPALSQLPGTIRIQKGAFTCVFPLLASIVISILLTVVLNVILRLIKR